MDARLVSLVLLLGLVVTSTPGRVAAQDKPIIAVFDMEDRGSALDKKTLDILTDYLAVRLVSCYNVIPREQIRQRIVANKKESHKTCYEQSCQVEMGRELAAQKSLSTKILKIADECTMTATLYDLRKSITEKAAMADSGCDKKRLLAAVGTIANDLCGVAAKTPPPATVPPREVKPPRETKPPRKMASSTPAPTPKAKPQKTPAPKPPEVSASLEDTRRTWNARVYLGFLIGNEELYGEPVDYPDDGGYVEVNTSFRLQLDGEVMVSDYLSMGAYFSYTPGSAYSEILDEDVDINFLNVGLMIKPRIQFGSIELRAALLAGYQNISDDYSSAHGLAVGLMIEAAYWLSHSIGVVATLGMIGQPVGGGTIEDEWMEEGVDMDITHAPMFFMMFGAEFGG